MNITLRAQRATGNGQWVRGGLTFCRVANCALLIALFAVGSARAANVATSPLSAARAYPNPWRSDKHMAMSIKFAGLPAASTVKIFTISGHEVKTVSADSNGLASWDRVNDQGDPVASGIYIYLIIDPHGNETSGKIAIIK